MLARQGPFLLWHTARGVALLGCPPVHAALISSSSTFREVCTPSAPGFLSLPAVQETRLGGCVAEWGWDQMRSKWV